MPNEMKLIGLEEKIMGRLTLEDDWITSFTIPKIESINPWAFIWDFDHIKGKYVLIPDEFGRKKSFIDHVLSWGYLYTSFCILNENGEIYTTLTKNKTTEVILSYI